MAEKDSNGHPQVTVHGKFVENASPAESEHQVYCYHVNILKTGQDLQQDYDRKIHIYQSSNKPEQEDKELNTAPTIHNDNEPPQTPPIQAVDTATIPESEGDQNSSLMPEEVSDKPSPKKWRVKKPDFKVPAFNLAPVKQLLASIKNWVTTIPQWMAGQVLRLRNRLSIPDLKLSPPRNIFANTNQKHIKKLGLITILALLGVLIFYFPTNKTETITPTNHQAVSKKPATKVVKPKQDYHAVIKQNTDGITITIQGPEHEEVLTKLPPGYHPVVVGNKIVHVVTRGNTLWFIAKRYIKNPYRYPELARLNKIKNPDLIYPGDRVIIQHIRKP